MPFPKGKSFDELGLDQNIRFIKVVDDGDASGLAAKRGGVLEVAKKIKADEDEKNKK